MNSILPCGLVTVLVLGSCLVQEDDKDRPVTGRGGAGGRDNAEGVTGHVLDSSGRPIAGALVRPKALGKPAPPIPEIAIISDETGRYVWRLAPALYEIAVSADGYRSVTKQARVRPGRQVTLDFALERSR